MVRVATAAGPVLARITRHSVAVLGLDPGVAVHAVVKSVAPAPENVGAARPADIAPDLPTAP